MTPAQLDAVWDAIDGQRARTADLLEQPRPSSGTTRRCARGWTVRHVAAHLTLQQQRVRDVAAFVVHHPGMLRSVTLNATIHDSAVLQAGALSSREIIDRIRAMIGSRRHNAFVTPLETLTDILVHSEDIAIALGLDLTMRPTASTRRHPPMGHPGPLAQRGLPPTPARGLPPHRHRHGTGHAGRDPRSPGPSAPPAPAHRSRCRLEHLTGEGAEALRSVVSRSAS